MGRYVPPEFEGVLSHNQVSSKHALGARASKSHLGILTVRFEMPFPIWCTACPKPTIIGQGVRFNAEKKKVGNYYSTPIYSFRMKHIACGGTIEIRTDPKNTAYVVAEGARKRDLGEDKVEEGDVKILTQEEREERRNNAFASLEGKNEDRERLEMAKERIEELQDVQDAHWDDPYEQNRKLRRAFRVGRKSREKDAIAAQSLQDKMSFGYDLLPENEDDARRAGTIDFGPDDSGLSTNKALSKPLFAGSDSKVQSDHQKSSSKLKKKPKAERLAVQRRDNLASEIRSNTWAKIDPFLADASVSKTSIQASLGIKRKREAHEAGDDTAPAKALVDYDSD